MKCTGACGGGGAGAGAGASTVYSVQSAVCCLLSSTGEDLAVEIKCKIVYINIFQGPHKYKVIT